MQGGPNRSMGSAPSGWPSLSFGGSESVNAWAFEAIGVGPDDYLSGPIPGLPSLPQGRTSQELMPSHTPGAGLQPAELARQNLFAEMFTNGSGSGSGFGFGDDVFDGEVVAPKRDCVL